MVRKRLSDLLKEEAQKSLPPDADPAASEPFAAQAAVPSPSPAPRAARRPSASAKADSAKVDSAKVDSTKVEGAKAYPAAAAEITALQTTVAELNAALAAAQQREDAFQQQIIDLKSALTGQAVHIQTLEAELAQTQSLKTELEHAKKHILQLSEATLRGNPAIASTAVSAPAPAARPAPAPALALSPQPPASSLAARGASRHEQELAKILQHPILPKPVSNGKTSDEMGWFD